jgi:antitoxin MazE
MLATNSTLQPSHQTTLSIKPWGNNLGVRIPSALAKAVKLRANQTVSISALNGVLTITPQNDAQLSLAQRLAAYNPAIHGGEVMASAPVGAEVL